MQAREWPICAIKPRLNSTVAGRRPILRHVPMSSELVLDGSLQALTPEALIRLLRVVVPSGAVTVKGVVTRLTYWPSEGAPKHCYGVLTLGAASIKFRIPPEANVRLDEPVLLHGTLEIAPTNEGKATHEIKLVGDAMGTWLPRKPEGHDEPLPPREMPPRSLGDFVAQQREVTRLGFLVTETAWNDLLTTSQLNELRRCPQRRTNFTRADIFLDDLRALRETEGVSGIVIARGGGDALDTIGSSLPVLKALLGTGCLSTWQWDTRTICCWSTNMRTRRLQRRRVLGIASPRHIVRLRTARPSTRSIDCSHNATSSWSRTSLPYARGPQPRRPLFCRLRKRSGGVTY